MSQKISGTIAVVIPCYKVRAHILSVLERIGPEVAMIYVVDDACPDQSWKLVEENAMDERVKILRNQTNLGVGGATIVGMKQAAADGATVLVKLDGDGQMDPSLIPSFTSIILAGEADFTKGNRFFEPEGLLSMPLGRIIGNAGLSFMAKISTGYWFTFDPTNGFIAIHVSLFNLLPLEKISKRYLFESDLLFRLNILGAYVLDVPMHAYYSDEVSGLKPLVEIPRFMKKYLQNFFKRILYNYFVRNFSIASIELVIGITFTLFGLVYGLVNWGTNQPATSGTVMAAALPIILGIQFLLGFINHDIRAVPNTPLHPRLIKSKLPTKVLKSWHNNEKAKT